MAERQRSAICGLVRAVRRYVRPFTLVVITESISIVVHAAFPLTPFQEVLMKMLLGVYAHCLSQTKNLVTKTRLSAGFGIYGTRHPEPLPV